MFCFVDFHSLNKMHQIHLCIWWSYRHLHCDDWMGLYRFFISGDRYCAILFVIDPFSMDYCFMHEMLLLQTFALLKQLISHVFVWILHSVVTCCLRCCCCCFCCLHDQFIISMSKIHERTKQINKSEKKTNTHTHIV